MVPGIALSLGLVGHDVLISGRRPEALDDVERRIEQSVSTLLDSGLLDEDGWQAARLRIQMQVGLDGEVARSTYVVEAIVEDLDLKRRVLVDVEERVAPETILASTTSALSPTAIQTALEHPERFVVTHYAQPAHLVPVVEVVPGEQTAAGTVERACAVLESCGLRPICCGDVPGFIWARIQMAVLREVLALVRNGVATVEDIETIMKFGYGSRLPAMGPFEHADLGGLDLIATTANYVWPDLDTSTDIGGTPLADLIAEHRLGMKTGRGFYDWEERNADEFRRERDLEVIRRLKHLRGKESQVVYPGR